MINMKKIAILLLLLPFVGSARTIREFFIAAPSEVVGYVGASSRLDMIDYFEAGMTDRTIMSNRNAGVRLTELSDSTLTLKAGEVQTITLRLLPAKSDSVIAVIETLATPAPDSRLSIYNKEWKMIPKAWTAPSDKAWGPHEGAFLLTEYILDGNTLILSDRTADWNKDLAPQTKTLKYVWQPKSVKFKQLK